MPRMGLLTRRIPPSDYDSVAQLVHKGQFERNVERLQHLIEEAQREFQRLEGRNDALDERERRLDARERTIEAVEAKLKERKRALVSGG